MKLILAIALLSSSLLAATPYPLGMNPSKHGVKATPIAQAPRFAAAPLPDTATLKQYFYRTNQGDIGSCGPTSAMEVYDALYQKMNGKRMVISALDLYQRVLIAQGQFPQDAGVSNDVLLKVAKVGTLLESTWPYDTSKLAILPPKSAAAGIERSNHQVLKGYVVPNNDNGYSVMQCIANVKIAPIIGTLWYNNGFTSKQTKCQTKDANGKTISVVRFVTPYPKGNPVGGHDIPAISYDKNLRFPTGEVGGVEIHNHWLGWGDSTGSSWVPMKWIFSARITDDDIGFEIVDK